MPWQDYNSSCWSAVESKNLGNREVAAELEAHESSGALASLVGHSGIQVGLSPGEHAEYMEGSTPSDLLIIDGSLPDRFRG